MILRYLHWEHRKNIEPMAAIDQNIISALNHSLEIVLSEKISFDELREKLSRYINDLAENNFQKLVSVLYRIDISESRLKKLLKKNPGINAGNIIADLIIERQEQKIKSRQQFSQRDKNIDEEDKW